MEQSLEKDSQEKTNPQVNMELESPNHSTPKKKHSPYPIILGIIILLLIVLLGGYFLFNSLQTKIVVQTTKSTIKIGVMGPFDSDSAGYAYSILKGAQLARKDLNADNVQLIQMNSACSADLAPTAMKKLIDQGVIAVIGDDCSGASLAALPLANKYKIVMLSPGASSDQLSIANDYFFRVVPADSSQGKFLAQLIFHKGLKKVAIFYVDENYGVNLTKIFTNNFKELGGTVLLANTNKRDILDLSKQAQAIKNVNPDAVLILHNSTTSSIAMMKQLREKGVNVPLFGSDGVYDDSLLTSGGAAAEGLTLTIFPNGTKEFKNSYIAEYGSQSPLNSAAEGYDAFNALYVTIQKGAQTGEQIAKLLPETDFEGVSAHITLDKFGDASGNYKYGVLGVHNGKFVSSEN